MQEDVRLERSHEEECGGARIADAQHAGRGGAAEVFGDDAETAAGRAVVALRVERDDERGLRAVVHVDGEVLGDGGLHERHEPLGDRAQHHARIGGRIDRLQRGDEVGHRDAPPAHRSDEQLVLRRRMTQQRRGRDPELRRDVGERGNLETLGHENAAGGVEELVAGNPRRAAH